MAMKVLLVDDDKDIAESIECIFVCSDMDVDFEYLPDGPSCIERMRRGFTGVLFMDVNMPGMDGWETIDKLIEEDLLNHCIISMFTAVDSPPADSEHLAAYVANYIRKPTTPAKILTAIEDASMMLSL